MINFKCDCGCNLFIIVQDTYNNFLAIKCSNCFTICVYKMINDNLILQLIEQNGVMLYEQKEDHRTQKHSSSNQR